LIGKLALNDQLSFVDPFLLAGALVDAARDIEFGLDNLSKAELHLDLSSKQAVTVYLLCSGLRSSDILVL
jgi:hypothetical protein